MPHHNGYRARTRHMFARKFRQHGMPNLATYLKPIKVGDYVDIVTNGAIHKGMPFKHYHGRTGVVFNITKRAVGVEVNKQVRQRIMKKRINVRIEHVRKSNCRKDFLRRVKENDALRREAKAVGNAIPHDKLKRQPAQPREGKFVRAKAQGQYPVVLTPKPFDEMF